MKNDIQPGQQLLLHKHDSESASQCEDQSLFLATSYEEMMCKMKISSGDAFQ